MQFWRAFGMQGSREGAVLGDHLEAFDVWLVWHWSDWANIAKEDAALELTISINVFRDVPQHLPGHVCDSNGVFIMLVFRLRNHHDCVICRHAETMGFDATCAHGQSFVKTGRLCNMVQAYLQRYLSKEKTGLKQAYQAQDPEQVPACCESWPHSLWIQKQRLASSIDVDRTKAKCQLVWPVQRLSQQASEVMSSTWPALSSSQASCSDLCFAWRTWSPKLMEGTRGNHGLGPDGNSS